jgi:hypothetical protein
MRRILTLSCLLVLVPAAALAGPACSVTSPAHRVALVELYTSEGCDSCPPADRALSAMRDAGLKPDEAVPLSMHVDYWDYIGWKDRFARPEFARRQRWLSERNASRVVYTPEFFASGVEARAWRGDLAQAVRALNREPARASITLALDSDMLTLTARAPGFVGEPNVFVALYENGLSSDVKAGENRGSTLRHDYVVRQWVGPIAMKAGVAQVSQSLDVRELKSRANGGVAAFVQDAASGQVLQAVSLPLCPG